MKMIVGLGNPGKKYENTRHNAGFIAIDGLAEKLNVTIAKQKYNALYEEVFINGEKIILVKPQTFMNLSGESVIQFVHYYDIDPEDILVISDDMNLAVGKIRIRLKGSSGGQKGIQNIIDLLGTNQFPRLRIGIGKNPQIDTVSYVLGKLDEDVAFVESVQALEDYVHGASIQELMNRYN